MAYHNPTLYTMKKVPSDLLDDMANFKYLVFGHLCPVCKETILDIQTMVQAFRLYPGPSNQQKYGVKRLHCKENYTLVCSFECAGKVQWHYANSEIKAKHIEKLSMYVGNGNGCVKPLKRSTTDSYRDMVLKNCGIDPKKNITYRVFQSMAEAMTYYLNGEHQVAQ